METNQPSAPQQQIQIKISDDILKGVYSNMAQISHVQEEFILDFMNVFFSQQPPQGVITSRVIVSPAHMKRIANAMQENIKRYEEKFGKIPENNNPQENNFGFRTE
jgi:hypothetical protein